MSRINAELGPVKFTGHATVLHKPGAIKLDGFPLLCYALKQWGDGIRIASNGASVEDICKAMSESSNAPGVAERFGISAEELAEAVKYATEAGAVSTKGE